MSERLTAIHLPGYGAGGLAEWGRHSVEEMIALYRKTAQQQLAEAQAVLAANDSDFFVETYLGPHARSKRKVLQCPLS